MKRFDKVKTIQLAVLILLACVSIYLIFIRGDLYSDIAKEPGMRWLAIVLWLTFGVSAGFLFYDFNSYADLKRENMELDNAIYSDALTGIANRYSVDVYIGQYLNKPLPADMGCVTCEITNMADINEKLGHTGGDMIIQAFSDILKNASKGVCFIGRNGGNKFVAIFRECTNKQIEDFIRIIDEQVKERNAAGSDHEIKYSVGAAFDEGDKVHMLTELVALSDRRAWENSLKDR